MRIVVYSPKQQSERSRLAITAFIKGLREHGHNPQVLETWYSTECDLAVWFGMPAAAIHIAERQRRDGHNFISIDAGYLGDRSKWHSIGFNGQNGRADFLNDMMPSKRAKQYKWKAKPWNRGADHILLCAQIPGDTALRGQDHEKWIEDIQTKIALITDTPIKLRPHPEPNMPHNKQKQSLAADLDGATCVVAFNSNTAVDAILGGIPAIVLDEGSMAYPVAGHYLADIETPPMPDDATIQQWLNDLAYCQWTIKEIETGLAWEHLKKMPAANIESE